MRLGRVNSLHGSANCSIFLIKQTIPQYLMLLITSIRNKRLLINARLDSEILTLKALKQNLFAR